MTSSHTRSVLVPALASLLIGAVLTGCADDESDTARDPQGSTSPSASSTPAPTSSPTPTDEPSPSEDAGAGSSQTLDAIGNAGVTEATLISATEGGGSESTLAFALDSEVAVADFVAQFEGGFVETVSTAVAKTAQQAPGATPYGATVSIGCEAPRGVAIDVGEAGFEVIPQLPKSSIQCLAPMTYVVLFAVPNA
ncbi:MAG: hypothetical protein LH477_04435 [Nocardioides sp.]|nr:hypothetical protein [Nocardioides sp.]